MSVDLSNAIPLIGIALCAMALFQFALWTAQSLSLLSQNNKQFELARELLRKQIDNSAPKSRREPALAEGSWIGFRSFQVSKLVRETSSCTSVYFQADDGKAIASFQPGQHLTFRFRIPGQAKPVVRCYSLSDRPGLEVYRITVKSVTPTSDLQSSGTASASDYIHSSLAVGDRVEVKSPAGHFVLDESTSAPIVMLAGGIGITPMLSMINHVINAQSGRQVLLIYGVRNSAEHAFKQHFESLAATHGNFHVLNFYSHPGPEDVEGQDYHARGRVSVGLLKQVFSNQDCQFYLCGPPPFMESIHKSLTEWGVSPARIFYESFGPASIRKTTVKARGTAESPAPKSAVTFAKSGVNANWDSNSESLLDLAEEHDVTIESGCRAGSCGTCATTILSGKVDYPDQLPVDCEPGQCLVCVAKPMGPLELDA